MGGRAEENRIRLFSFALPAGRPYQRGVQALINECGYGALRNNGNRGGARVNSAGLVQHHSVAHQHGAPNLHRNKDKSNGDR